MATTSGACRTPGGAQIGTKTRSAEKVAGKLGVGWVEGIGGESGSPAAGAPWSRLTT